MSPERWQRIRHLFDAAVQQPAEDRAVFLDAACRGDSKLRADVEAFLASDLDASLLLSAPVDRRGLLLVDDLLREHHDREARHVTGRMIGPYRLLRKIEEGGMGVVYVAERADGQFEQRVALKVIKRGMESAFMLQRFLRERQILAGLHHPNIARLYDGGVTDDGRPYFAMEYVDGRPLTSYCDAHRLGLEERLRLFLVTAAAVHFAHRNLVVHRDLKPSNILVTHVEAALEPQVKLLDFGIAKLLASSEHTNDHLATGTGQYLMTPAYAAPEQVCGAPITTATDVYALGVILYELLSGRRPYAFPSTAPDVVSRTILYEQPLPPSAAVSGAAAVRETEDEIERLTPSAIGHARGVSVDRLRRRLAGDLDTICLMALRKEPERRYASVEALGEDIRRHLTGMPVSARRDTITYRMSTFIRRHKIGVAAVTLAAISLLTGLTVALWQASEARRQQQEKQIEATRANVTRDYIVSLFEHLDPYEAQGRRFTARELIDPGIRRLESLAGQPLERAAIMRVLGEASASVGLLTTADSLFAGALAIQLAELAPDDPDIATTMEGRASAQLMLQAHGEAQRLLEQALTLRRESLQPGDPQLLKTLNQLAYVLSVQWKLDESEARYREALSFRDRANSSDLAEIARSLRGIAEIHVKRGRHEDAMPLLDEAVALYEETLGPTHTETGRTLFSLAQVLRTTGDYRQSESLFNRALEISERVYGRQNHRAATILYEIGLLKESAEEFEDAAWFFQEAASIYEQVLPETHVHKAYPLQELGLMLLMTQGRPAEAEEPLRRALAIYEKALPAQHLDLIKSRLELAACLFRMERYEEADSLLRSNYAALTERADTTAAAEELLAQTLRGLVTSADRRGTLPAADTFRTALDALSGSK